ncbi:hypothetical protein COB72_10970 [bacterium]|nr:MAG: hypothetical protein COB72_10970 [bacterium]
MQYRSVSEQLYGGKLIQTQAVALFTQSEHIDVRWEFGRFGDDLERCLLATRSHGRRKQGERVLEGSFSGDRVRYISEDTLRPILAQAS